MHRVLCRREGRTARVIPPPIPARPGNRGTTGTPVSAGNRQGLAERCRSGRTGLTRNQVYGLPYRGFESLSLRQIENPRQRVFYLAERAGCRKLAGFDKSAQLIWTEPRSGDARRARAEGPQSIPLRQTPSIYAGHRASKLSVHTPVHHFPRPNLRVFARTCAHVAQLVGTFKRASRDLIHIHDCVIGSLRYWMRCLHAGFCWRSIVSSKASTSGCPGLNRTRPAFGRYRLG